MQLIIIENSFELLISDCYDSNYPVLQGHEYGKAHTKYLTVFHNPKVEGVRENATLTNST